MGVEADFLGLRAVHREVHIGLIEWLLNPHICYPRHVPDLVEQRVCISMIARQIIAEDLNVNGGWQTEI